MPQAGFKVCPGAGALRSPGTAQAQEGGKGGGVDANRYYTADMQLEPPLHDSKNVGQIK